MRDKHNRSSRSVHLIDFREAFGLKPGVTHRQNFIYE
jgi:hypothetical protein